MLKKYILTARFLLPNLLRSLWHFTSVLCVVCVKQRMRGIDLEIRQTFLPLRCHKTKRITLLWTNILTISFWFFLSMPKTHAHKADFGLWKLISLEQFHMSFLLVGVSPITHFDRHILVGTDVCFVIFVWSWKVYKRWLRILKRRIFSSRSNHHRI